jgi:hypothetical protein
MKFLEPGHRALFFFVSFIISAFFYKLGELVNQALWPLKTGQSVSPVVKHTNGAIKAKQL